jgi:acetyl-CoA C-acetyltransferase
MPEAVIVAIGRSPVGRAAKGSLVDVRPDDLGAYIVLKVLEQVPQLPSSEIVDLMCGCALPGGEQSHNMGHAISLLTVSA